MKSSISNVYKMILILNFSGNAMKEVMTFFGLALVFFAIAYFIGLPTVVNFFKEYTCSY